MRAVLFLNNLFLILAMIGSSGYPTQSHTGAARLATSARSPEIRAHMANMNISLKVAANATILFKAENGKEVNAPNEEDRKIPYLVLNRNGVATPNFERTLHLSLNNVRIPASGLYASLEIETQHADPDLGQDSSEKIRVWEEKRFFPYNSDSETPQSIDFTVVFQRVFEYQGRAMRTPTDYYRYRVSLRDAQGNLLREAKQEYAFLLENQWRVPLPNVLEDTPGAAPQQLVVYFYDMIPFQASFRDPETRIPRQDVERYIQTELIPVMVEAFQVQTNVWDMPWYEEWTNSRKEEDPKTLSVALGEHGTWFHGAAPSLGLATISIRVDGSFGEYANITDGIMSVFHHELFHNQQRNISLHFGAKGIVSGKEQAWELFSEGTAVLASLVGQPAVQMEFSTMPRSYLKRANAFLGVDGIFPGGLNMSYTEIPYHTALYWRYLYEQCAGIRNGIEDPAAGMQIIRHVLETLYSGNIVDTNSSTSAVEDFPKILDVALYKTPTCPFHSYEESLVHFTRAVYLLRQDHGRCANIASSSGCGFFDPKKLYSVPSEESYSIEKNGRTNITGTIRSSFGVDLIKVSTDPSLNGKSLRFLFRSAENPGAAYNVEIWAHQEKKASADEPIGSKQTRPGITVVEIGRLSMEDLAGLDLVITRLDTNENILQPGQYTIQVIVD